MNLTLQNILFPAVGKCTEQELYFRTKSNHVRLVDGKTIFLPRRSQISFDAYFNSFSWEKWAKYTNIHSLSLNLQLNGKARIKVMRTERTINGETITEVMADCMVEGSDKPIALPCLTNAVQGVIWFSVEAVSDVTIARGLFSAELPEEAYRHIKIALDICTYKREKFIQKNLGLLNAAFLENKASFLYDKLEVFISDNGQTLDTESLSTEKIHVFYNKNAGGSAGFTRGMIEIGRVREDRNITHILVMDDDVTIEPEAIFRTVALLSCLKEKYSAAFVGGAMLRLDTQYRQIEAGAYWNQGEILPLKTGLDLRSFQNCLYNEVDENPEYNAWWYCCFPAEVPMKNNLPLPFFIRGDDLEYSMRNKRYLILMNGICVWHEPFENKYSSFLFYYILRNRLIVNAIHGQSMKKRKFKRLLYCQVYDEIRLYRYKNANLLMQGVEDFLKGVDWLAAQKGDELHLKIMREGYSLKYPEEIDKDLEINLSSYYASIAQPQKMDRFYGAINKLTNNGHILPTNRKYVVVPTVGAKRVNVYRCKTVINYDYCSRKCFVTPRSWAEARSCGRRLRKLLRSIDRQYSRAIQDYQANYRKLTSLDFWNAYLGLPSNTSAEENLVGARQ